jgi:AcrR family transcriptional regulator
MPDATRDRILDAALAAAAIHGISRLSLADVAKQAQLSRQTVYKHFASKDELVAATVLREADEIGRQVIAATDAEDDPRVALEVAILTVLTLAREHPLLDRIIRTEPESLLPVLTSDGGPVVGAMRQVAEHLIARRVPTLSPVELRRAADALTRLLVSYAVNAPDDPPDVVAATLAGLLAPGVMAVDPDPRGARP